MHSVNNDFDALKIACGAFARFVGPLEVELAKNGSGSQVLVESLRQCAAQAAQQVVLFKNQKFLAIYGSQPQELIFGVEGKCAKLGIVL